MRISHLSFAAPALLICSLAGTAQSTSSSVAATSVLSVAVSPTSARVQAGHTLQFRAKVSGTCNEPVTWSIHDFGQGNSAVGTISHSGLYTAPESVRIRNLVILARCSAEPTAFGRASLTVRPAPELTVSVMPKEASVQAGHRLQFRARVSGTCKEPLTWSIHDFGQGNSAVGTISRSGLYTAPESVRIRNLVILARCSAQSVALGRAYLTVRPAPHLAVSLTPTSASVQVGQKLQFKATVSGTTNQAVTWSVNSIAGGNSTVGEISSSGLYTAPASVPSTNVVIVARSVAQKTATGVASISIKHKVSVSVSPQSASVVEGQSLQFRAKVSGTGNQAVNWMVNGFVGGNSTVGKISSSGLYIAPGSVPSARIIVSAQSLAQASASSSASVTITAPQQVTVSLSPSSTSVQVGKTQQFSAMVSGTSNTAVNWLVNGVLAGSAAIGSISSSGLYTAPATVPSSPVTVSAKSVAQPTVSASAEVSITPATVTVSISPVNVSVDTGHSQQFSATVSGTSITSVNWLVSGIQGGNSTLGTITSAGLYTAPAAVPSASVVVTAKSSASPTSSASAAVAIVQPVVHSVSLSWAASGSAVAGYNVYRGTQPAGPFTRINPALETATVYTDSSVASGHTYYYVTTAVSSTGVQSGYSNVAQAIIP